MGDPASALEGLCAAVRGAGPPGKFDASSAVDGSTLAPLDEVRGGDGGGETSGGIVVEIPAAAAAAAGATGKATLSVTGMTCTTCANTVERTVMAVRLCVGVRAPALVRRGVELQIKGVVKVKVALLAERVEVLYDKELVTAVTVAAALSDVSARPASLVG